MGNTGVTEDYQSDLSYSLNSSTVGGGLGIGITENIMLNLGGGYTFYQDGRKNRYGILQVACLIPLTFAKSNLILGIGLDISF